MADSYNNHPLEQDIIKFLKDGGRDILEEGCKHDIQDYLWVKGDDGFYFDITYMYPIITENNFSVFEYDEWIDLCELLTRPVTFDEYQIISTYLELVDDDTRIREVIHVIGEEKATQKFKDILDTNKTERRPTKCPDCDELGALDLIVMTKLPVSTGWSIIPDIMEKIPEAVYYDVHDPEIVIECIFCNTRYDFDKWDKEKVLVKL